MNKLFFITVLLFSQLVSAQYDKGDSNRIGITVGVNQFMLETDNFTATPSLGWNAGLSVRGNFYNYWEMVYAMQFSENNFTVATTNAMFANEEINYKLPSVQFSLQLSYRIIRNHLSVEFGPVVQINGKLKIDESKEDNTISGSSLKAKDIQDISKFNFYPAVGITAGLKHFRVNIQYLYGVNNILENLNTQNSSIDFKGNAGILSANVIVYL